MATQLTFGDVVADVDAHHPGRIALACASFGWRVIPLRHATKQPVLHGWPRLATTDCETIIEWWSGRYVGSLCGIATGRESGVWVLDIDRKEDDGLAHLQRLEVEHGELPRTFTVRTPNAGEHRYFTYPTDVEVASRGTTDKTSVEWRGVESRGWHGQVVAPGTRLGVAGDGTYREYVIVDDSALAPAPDWLTRHFTRREREPWVEMVPDHSFDVGLQEWALDELWRTVDDVTRYPELGPGDSRYGARRAGSGANTRLNGAAYYLATIATHGLLTRDEVVNALADACRTNHLWEDEGEGQCLATIDSGWSAGLSFPTRLPLDHRAVPEYVAFVDRMRTVDDVTNTPNGESGGGNVISAVAAVVDIKTRERLNVAVELHPPGGIDGVDVGTGGGITTRNEPPSRNTDRANALELIFMFGDHLCWTPQEGWLHWDGRRWRPDHLKGVRRLCELLAETLLGRLPTQDEVERKVTWQRVKRLESSAGVDATLTYAEPMVARSITDFDRNPWLLNCPNGTLDLRTGELRAHDPGDLITRLCPTEYVPGSEADVRDLSWELFLSTSLPGPEHVVFQRFVGSCLTGIVRDKAFLVPTGPKHTGKSTATEPILRVLGDVDEGGYATTWDEQVIQRGTRVNRDEKANKARAARLVVVGELTRGSRFEDSFVKRITGGDTIDARPLYRKSFSYRPQFKLIMHSNFVPKSADPALHARLKLLPFQHVFEERDDAVKQHLETDQEAAQTILAWAVQGCLDWQREGLGEMPWLTDMLRSYALDSDQVLAFWADALESTDVRGEFPETQAVWQAYEVWAFQGGERPMKRRAFERALEERGLARWRPQHTSASRTTYWSGVKFRVEGP